MCEGGAAKAKSRVVCVGTVFVLSFTALLVNLYCATSLPGGGHFTSRLCLLVVSWQAAIQLFQSGQGWGSCIVGGAGVISAGL